MNVTKNQEPKLFKVVGALLNMFRLLKDSGGQTYHWQKMAWFPLVGLTVPWGRYIFIFCLLLFQTKLKIHLIIFKYAHSSSVTVVTVKHYSTYNWPKLLSIKDQYLRLTSIRTYPVNVFNGTYRLYYFLRKWIVFNSPIPISLHTISPIPYDAPFYSMN